MGITVEEVDITAEATTVGADIIAELGITAEATTVEAGITGASAVMEAGTMLMG